MLETKHQAILSSIVGGVIVFIYLSISNVLDHYIPINVSNMIGLIIDFALNIFAQQYIFYGKLKFNNKLLSRFLIGSLFSLLCTQLIFIYGEKYYDRLFQKYNYKHLVNPDMKLAIWRYLSNVIMFFTVTFPLRKYYIFK